MWWAKFILLMVITIGVTSLIVWGDSQIRKKFGANSGTRGVFRTFVVIILNLRDLLKL
jgi:hypothetical protein